MKIEDDFLDEKEFGELQAFMMDDVLAWYYNNIIDYDDVGTYQFTHNFYSNYAPTSNFIERLHPILKLIQPLALSHIKANLLVRTPNIVENAFHVDMSNASEEKLKQWTTSIFYVNTNNGYTKFEDGTKVESVANRMVTFPSNLEHTGTSCTDEKTRVVINFNYFKR